MKACCMRRGAAAAGGVPRVPPRPGGGAGVEALAAPPPDDGRGVGATPGHQGKGVCALLHTYVPDSQFIAPQIAEAPCTPQHPHAAAQGGGCAGGWLGRPAGEAGAGEKGR